MDNSSNNKRIAKNTIILYVRMIFIVCIGLYTSRVILNALGAEDYGLYNVVGGFVAFFTFLNGAMTTSTQRFITFGLAQNDIEKQKTTFSTAIIIHLSLALIIVLLAETIGLWFVTHKLVIPASRFNAAIWVYHLSIISMFISIISIPYNALIIAHEKMSVFAYISMSDAVLKLVIVFLLTITKFDRLILYAILLTCVAAIDRVIYGIYCNKSFEEANFKLVFDKRIFKDMTNIAGWSLFGNVAGVFYTQGLNVLLNIFFNPAVNAARGIAVNVQGILSGFISNFQMAVNPQITKSYASSDLGRMHELIFASSKFSFYLLLIIVVPIILEAPFILTLWLKTVPEHTISFLRLILVIMLTDTLANPLMISSQAVGKVKVYQSIVGCLLILILPIAYIFLKLGCPPESVFIIQFLMAILAQVARIIIVCRMIRLSILTYVRKILLPIVITLLALSFEILVIANIFHSDAHMLNILIAIILTLMTVFFVGISKNERDLIFNKGRSIIKHIAHI